MKITFCGATRQVTGSMFRLQTESGYNILIDCGLSYEPGTEITDNSRLPFEASEIDVVILTHAHMDHSGNIPTLVHQGFKGSVFCTEPTADLISGLLMDSANIQLNKSRKNKKKSSKQTNPVLYGHKQVMDAMGRVITLSFDQRFDLNEEVSFWFRKAGHILGAASIELEIKENQDIRRIGFTGDLGRTYNPILVAPEPMLNLDYLVCESTYGARNHRQHRDATEVLFEHVEHACIKQKGKLIIPAFSVGRTQAILFTLNQLYQDGRLGNIKVFTDSPLGILSTKIHEHFHRYLNPEALIFLRNYGSLFSFPNLLVVEDKEDKLEMEFYNKPSIVVSSAGMMEGGRIQEHVANNLQNPFCTILSAGYCAAGTLGAALLEGRKRISIRGREREIYARIESMDVYSAHSDASELLNYVRTVHDSKALKKVFLVHGDAPNMTAFKESIENSTDISVHVPTYMEEVHV